MKELAQLRDNQPIRASCFSPSGNYFVLGTNSKALKICALPKLNGATDEEDDNIDSSGGPNIGANNNGGSSSQSINVILEQ